MNAQFANFVAAAPDHYQVLWWIVLLPLVGAVLNGLFGKQYGREGVSIVGVGTVAGSFVLALFAFTALLKANHGAGEQGAQLSYLAWEWFRAPIGGGEAVALNFRYVLDSLSAIMLLVVTGVGTLIHVYSVGYMGHDEGYARYFAYLNLFMFSMLNLILADSLPLLFVGWEGVGLCSYLLIGFWFTNTQYASAGRKAFIVNRIGDVGVILGITILAWKVGAYDFSTLRERIDPATGSSLHDLGAHADLDAVVSSWLSSGFGLMPENPWLHEKLFYLIPRVTWGGLASILLFFGCTGKSAQIPLYVWLPDAMAGPTPVSALIHAATMVTAGVYLLCRMSFMFVHFPSVLAVVAVTGALTALFAATIAMTQNDLKKVLAYSTVSQLGFMFLACGVGAFGAGLFHVYTHAMFKACLFLGAGAVMHACRDKQDIRELGGLRRYLPITYATFGLATLSIIGFPLLAGFFSKDEILFRAFASHNVLHLHVAHDLLWHGYSDAHPDSAPDLTLLNLDVGKFVFYTGVLAATLTAFYMCRLFFLTFWGDFKGWSLVPDKSEVPTRITRRPSLPPEPPHAASHSAHADDHDHGHGHGHHDGNPWDPPKENPLTMTGVLVALGFMSVFAGYIGLPFAWTHHENVIGTFLESSVAAQPHFAAASSLAQENIAMLFGTVAFVVGSLAAYFVYVMQQGRPAKELVAMGGMRPIYRLALDKWRIDELYDILFVRPLRAIADACSVGIGFTPAAVIAILGGLLGGVIIGFGTHSVSFALLAALGGVLLGVSLGVGFDRFADFVLTRLPALVAQYVGWSLRKLQTGRVQVYGTMVAFGGLALLAWSMARPAPTIAYRADGTHLTLQAYGGPAYTYEWDLRGDGNLLDCRDPNRQTSSAQQETTCTPVEQPDGRRVCQVRVHACNAFGYGSVVTRTVEIRSDAEERQ